ncbi:MAG: NAD-dependent epimerase/dehydratase family protein [Bacteroidota bacterium]
MAPLRILITGINGLIGNILHRALASKYEVYGLDQDEPFSDRVGSADVSVYQQVAQVVEKFSPLDDIIHLAGNLSPTASWEDVLGANIVGTRNIFEAAREFRVPRVVYASSNHVTGGYEGIESNYFLHRQTEPVRIRTTDPVRPDSEYGVSKVFGESIGRYYCAKWAVEAICLRIGAVLKDDDPTQDARNLRIWLSHRDLVQLVEKSLLTNVPYGIYYGISNNKGAFYDLTNARDELGFVPLDDASAVKPNPA